MSDGEGEDSCEQNAPQKKRAKHSAAEGKGTEKRSDARWSRAHAGEKTKAKPLSMTNILKQQGAQRLKTLEDHAAELKEISIEMEGHRFCLRRLPTKLFVQGISSLSLIFVRSAHERSDAKCHAWPRHRRSETKL